MERLIHLLIPRESNNHKAKILHSSGLFIVTLVVLVFYFGSKLVSNSTTGILGYSSSISVNEVVRLTNLKRNAAGLPNLTFNQTLSNAAYSKGQDMINRDYWAHVAPDGTQPWKFFTNFGYKYKYAGENLARDFSSASTAVDAWMNSPSHRDNILNPKYKEIGIGVVEGDLSGSDTTIIVQFFGTSYVDSARPSVATTEKSTNEQESMSIKTNNTLGDLTSNQENLNLSSPEVNNANVQKVLVSPFNTTKMFSYVVVAALIVIFVVDSLIVSRKRISRTSGRTFAHVAFLGMIFAILLILKAGKVI